MRKLIAKLIKKIFRAAGRFLWPEKRKKKKRGSFEVKLQALQRTRLIDTAIKESINKEITNLLPPLAEWPILNVPPSTGVGVRIKAEDERRIRSLQQRMIELNAPDPSLPVMCTACGRPTQASKVDDRLVACIPCKMVFMTAETADDPNIARDLTHANLGITPRITTTAPRSKWEKMVYGWWEKSNKSISWEDYWAELKSQGPDLRRSYGEAIDLIREREMREAGAFGRGYTHGKYGISREEFNKQKREELEDDENEEA